MACLLFLQQPPPKPPTAAALAAVLSACRQCMDKTLAPVVLGIDRMLHDSWDTITPQGLMQNATKAAQVAYATQPTALQWLGTSLAPLAQLLHWDFTSHTSGTSQTSGTSGGSGGGKAGQAAARTEAGVGVPAVDGVVGMLGVVLFRRVVLEQQAALDARAQAVRSLAAALGWPEPHLAACCSAPQRTLLLAAHLPSSLGQGERRVKLTVRRGAAFWDAFRDADRQRLRLVAGSGGSGSGEMGGSGALGPGQPCKVFPSFREEWADGAGTAGGGADGAVEAGEGHGPRKEFFVLAGADAAGVAGAGGQRAGPALLSFNRTAGAFWFNTALEKDDDLPSAYEFLGWLTGQSILNRAPLGLPLAPLLLTLLLHGPTNYQPTMSDLQRFDPAAATAILTAAALPKKQLTDLLEMEGMSVGLTGEQYAEAAVRQLLVEQVSWQAEAMSAGLRSVLDPSTCALWCVGAAELAAAVSGDSSPSSSSSSPTSSTPLDLRRLFRVIMDDELAEGGDGDVVGHMLWEVVGSWPRDRQLQFVEFVTGTRRLPLAGTELLKVECPFVAISAAQKAAMLQTLPQAHTCDNLLELPNYWVALLTARKQVSRASGLSGEEVAALRQECRALIDDRLTVAITGCMGYGLDERG